MRFLTTLFAFLLFSHASDASVTKIFIKFSVLDCVTCTAALPHVLDAHSTATIILDSELLDDSVEIIEKFGLRRYAASMVWDNKLYWSLSKDVFSEVVQFCDDLEVQRMPLKGLSTFAVARCPSLPEISCTYKTPKQFSMSDFAHYTFVNNYVTDAYLMYRKSRDTLLPLTAGDDIVARVQSLFLAEHPEYPYAFLQKTTGLTKPKITGVVELPDSSVRYTLVTYYIDEISGSDTFYSKILSLITARNKQVIDVALVHTTIKDSLWALNEYGMFCYGDDVYFTILPRHGVERAAHELKILAKLTKRGSVYSADQPSKFPLNKNYSQTGVGYNYTDPYQSDRFVAFGLSDDIIDLKSGNTFPLPLKRDVFEANLGVKITELKYILNDLAFNEATNKLSLLFEWRGSKYYAAFTPYSNKLDTMIELFPMSYFKSTIKAATLGFDGRRLTYVLQRKGCFQECDFEKCAEVLGREVGVTK